jgi:hypothetical protein
MREIVFRGKCKANGEWVYGGVLRYDDDREEKAYIVIKSISLPFSFVEVNPETLGQYRV